MLCFPYSHICLFSDIFENFLWTLEDDFAKEKALGFFLIYLIYLIFFLHLSV